MGFRERKMRHMIFAVLALAGVLAVALNVSNGL